MENNDVEDKRSEVRDQLVKLLLGTATGFLASKLVENGYDALMAKRRNQSTNTED